jgi:uncharacterized protein
MFRTLRPYWVALVCIWIALIAAALFEKSRLENSHWIMTGLLPAFVVESAGYLACGFHSTRAILTSLPKWRFAALLAASGLAPYFLLNLGTGLLNAPSTLILAGLLVTASFWYVVMPQRVAFDAGFLLIAAAPMVLHDFPRLYPTPNLQLHVDILGNLAWIHVTFLAFFVIRGWDRGTVSFWPSSREWQWGALTFAVSAGVLAFVAPAVHFATFAVPQKSGWLLAGQAIGVFFGILFVVAFWEEAFCRGVIVHALKTVRMPVVLIVVISSLLFGALHLWYHAFPNWPFFWAASTAGVFYALVYLRTGSARASMVTHALTVTFWRLFFH